MLLQFITDAKSKQHSVTEQIESVIKGGCKWITIKMDDASDEEIKKVVEEVKPLCLKEEVFLILENHVDLAKEVNVGGVELNASSIIGPSKARMILGPAAVIGITVNDESTIDSLKIYDIDYFKIGPFNRKINDKDSYLSIDEIHKLCNYIEDNDISIAHVAYGDIGLEDVDTLMSAGVNGIVVSQAISEAEDMTEETVKFINKLKPYIKTDEELKID